VIDETHQLGHPGSEGSNDLLAWANTRGREPGDGEDPDERSARNPTLA
jgi:hypothetical protein